jgi:hypothetical protein
MNLFGWSLYLPELAPDAVFYLIVTRLSLILLSIFPFYYGMVSRSNCIHPILSALPAYYVILAVVTGNVGDLISFNRPEVLGYKLTIPSVGVGVNEVLD